MLTVSPDRYPLPKDAGTRTSWWRGCSKITPLKSEVLTNSRRKGFRFSFVVSSSSECSLPLQPLHHRYVRTIFQVFDRGGVHFSESQFNDRLGQLSEFAMLVLPSTLKKQNVTGDIVEKTIRRMGRHFPSSENGGPKKIDFKINDGKRFLAQPVTPTLRRNESGVWCSFSFK